MSSRTSLWCSVLTVVLAAWAGPLSAQIRGLENVTDIYCQTAKHAMRYTVNRIKYKMSVRVAIRMAEPGSSRPVCYVMTARIGRIGHVGPRFKYGRVKLTITAVQVHGVIIRKNGENIYNRMIVPQRMYILDLDRSATPKDT